jgi:hypothetical protein
MPKPSVFFWTAEDVGHKLREDVLFDNWAANLQIFLNGLFSNIHKFTFCVNLFRDETDNSS